MLKRINDFIINNIVIVFIAALVILMVIVSSNFFTTSNMINILTQISIYGVGACAMTIAIVCGEFDLSMNTIFPLATVIFAMLAPTLGIALAMLVAVLAGCAFGCINGLLVSFARINAFIATLSVMIFVMGFALTICDGKPVSVLNDVAYEFGTGSLGGVIPYISLIMLAFVAITEFVLKKTSFGRNVYAVGGSYDVAKLSGINVRLIKFLVFVITGGVAAFAGTMLASRLQAGSPIYGQDIALTVVSAAVVGGTSLSGGKGGALRTLLGMIFIGLVYQIFTFINVPLYLQDTIKGGMVIFVILIDALKNRRRVESPQTAGQAKA